MMQRDPRLQAVTDAARINVRSALEVLRRVMASDKPIDYKLRTLAATGNELCRYATAIREVLEC